MYHLFRRTVALQNCKKVKCVGFMIPMGKEKNRVCPNCTSRGDAEAAWQGINIAFPTIPRFQNNYRK